MISICFSITSESDLDTMIDVVDLDRHLDECGNGLWVKEIRRSPFGSASVKRSLLGVFGNEGGKAKAAQNRLVNLISH